MACIHREVWAITSFDMLNDDNVLSFPSFCNDPNRQKQNTKLYNHKKHVSEHNNGHGSVQLMLLKE